MKFSLIHPSRKRPQQAIQTALEWINKSGGDVEYIISLDDDDPTKDEYLKLLMQIPKYKVVINKNTCVVEATNQGAKHASGDVLIYLTDDFKCPDNWAQLIEAKNLEGKWILKVDDCLQPFNVAILTVPIVSREAYKELGYFWHPEYKSMFVDEDLYWTAKNRGWIRLAPELKFPHHHPSNGKAQNDETYIRSSKNWNQGQELFNRRKALNFPL